MQRAWDQTDQQSDDAASYECSCSDANEIPNKEGCSRLGVFNNLHSWATYHQALGIQELACFDILVRHADAEFAPTLYGLQLIVF